MRIAKRVLATMLSVFALLLLAAGGAYLVIDNATMAAWLSKQLEATTGTNITYANDAEITRTLKPTISLNKLMVADLKKNFKVQISSLQLQVSLPALLLGQLDIPRLVLGDTFVEIKETYALKETGASDKPNLLSNLPLAPTLHDVQISRLSIIQAKKKIKLPAIHLNELAIRLDPDSEKLVLTVQPVIADKTYDLVSTFPSLQKNLANQRLPFSISAQGAIFELTADGQIDFSQSPPTVNAHARAEVSDLKQISGGTNDFLIPGKLTGQTQISGNFKQLALEDISATWQGPKESKAQLTGRVENILKLSGFALNATGQLFEPSWLAAVLPENLGTIKSVSVSTKISGAYNSLNIHKCRLEVKTADELDLLASGKLDIIKSAGSFAPENIDLKLTFAAPTTRAARTLLFENVWEFGAVKGRADIHSSTGDPWLENIVVQTKDPDGIEVDLKGRIKQMPLDPEKQNQGYHLEVSMQADKTSVMGKRVGISLPLSGPLDAKFIIAGDTRALRLEQVSLSTGDVEGLQIGAQGQVLFGDWELPDPVQSIEFELQGSSPDTQALGKAIGRQLPELGGLSAKARLHTVSGRHRVDALHLETADDGPLQVRVAGSVEDILFLPEPGLNGIRLTVTASADETGQLSQVLHLKKTLPAIGPLKASANINGNHKNIAINDLSIVAGRKETFYMQANGQLGELQAADNWQLHNPALKLNAESTSSNLFAKVLGHHFPDLGPVAMTADLFEKEKKLQLKFANFMVGDGNEPALKAQGFIDDLFAAGQVRFDVKLNLADHHLKALTGNHPLPDLGVVTGDMVISNSDGSLGIDSLQVKSRETEQLFLEITGRFDDFKVPDTLSFKARLKARDLQLIGSLFGQKWPAVGPVELNSQIIKKGESTEFETTITAGETDIDAVISCLLHTDPPRIRGKINGHKFFFPDFLHQAKTEVKEKELRETYFFSRKQMSFDWLKKADVELSVNLESFDKEWSQLESAKLEITLKSGRLSLNPVTLVYPKGRLEVIAELDAQAHPQVNFKAFGQEINPWLALDMLESKTTFDPELDVDIEVMSSGVSLHELAANLQGSVYLTIKDGKVRKELLDLIFVDLVGWTISKTLHEKYVQVDCGVADYHIDKGVISTTAFFIDTKGIAIAGDGTIDLGQELVDYVFLPKKKSMLVLSADPVKVKGPLKNPAVKMIPWKSAVSTYGSLFFAPYIFVGISTLDFLSNKMNVGITKSPCAEYRKQYGQKLKKNDKTFTPPTPFGPVSQPTR